MWQIKMWQIFSLDVSFDRSRIVFRKLYRTARLRRLRRDATSRPWERRRQSRRRIDGYRRHGIANHFPTKCNAKLADRSKANDAIMAVTELATQQAFDDFVKWVIEATGRRKLYNLLSRLNYLSQERFSFFFFFFFSRNFISGILNIKIKL